MCREFSGAVLGLFLANSCTDMHFLNLWRDNVPCTVVTSGQGNLDILICLLLRGWCLDTKQTILCSVKPVFPQMTWMLMSCVALRSMVPGTLVACTETNVILELGLFSGFLEPIQLKL